MPEVDLTALGLSEKRARRAERFLVENRRGLVVGIVGILGASAVFPLLAARARSHEQHEWAGYASAARAPAAATVAPRGAAILVDPVQFDVVKIEVAALTGTHESRIVPTGIEIAVVGDREVTHLEKVFAVQVEGAVEVVRRPAVHDR